MRMYDVIRKKRLGEKLTNEEIKFFVENYTNGTIPDYQAAALCMAICCYGCDDEEIFALTDAMEHSGQTIDLSEFGENSVDKHSTGGVGDKTSLVVAPTVAALGCKLAKMTGRGLGHTGGTIDKLESIPGYNVFLSEEQFLENVRNIGVCLIGQSGELAPADKKLYALRDVTATVDSIPLIVSSIMSKKLAAGAHSIVLDVKTGSGAFMKTVDDAKVLAEKMVKVGEMSGRKVTAIVTNMDIPLGKNIGNALEVEEAVGVLKGEVKGDLYEVCVTLASALVSMQKKISFDDAKVQVVDCIASGKSFNKMKEWIASQGGDTSVLDDTNKLVKAKYSYEIKSPKTGYISHMDTEKVGITASLLGAGRINKEDSIDYSAGIVLNHKTGEFVNEGDTLCTLYASKEELFKNAVNEYLSALEFSNEEIETPKLIYAKIGG